MSDPLGNSFVPSGATKVSGIELDTFEGSIHAVRTTGISSNMQVRVDYSTTDGTPSYAGYAPRGLSSSTNGWMIKKFTYSSNLQCTLIQIAYGNWDNRASESYA